MRAVSTCSGCGPYEREFAGSRLNRMYESEKNEQLDLLRDRLLLLGGKTEEAVHRAVRSLTERNSDLAKSVCEDDELIDRMELEIDRLSIEILGSQRPTEHDLRLVVSVAKITPILERIADHASSIAEAAMVLNNEPQIDSYVDFSHMAEIAAEMLREALNAFTSEDADASRQIIGRDLSLDQNYGRVFDGADRDDDEKPGSGERSGPAVIRRQAHRADRRLCKRYLRTECLPDRGGVYQARGTSTKNDKRRHRKWLLALYREKTNILTCFRK